MINVEITSELSPTIHFTHFHNLNIIAFIIIMTGCHSFQVMILIIYSFCLKQMYNCVMGWLEIAEKCGAGQRMMS